MLLTWYFHLLIYTHNGDGTFQNHSVDCSGVTILKGYNSFNLKQDRWRTYKCNINACSCEHYCRGKVISITHSDFHKKRTKVTATGHKHIRTFIKTMYPIVMCLETVCDVRPQAEEFDNRKITDEYERHLVLFEVSIIIDCISDAKIRRKWRVSIKTRDSGCRVLAPACSSRTKSEI